MKLIKSADSEWTYRDQVWFASHPGKDWYVREPIGGEIQDFILAGGDLADVTAALCKAAEDPRVSHNTFRILVLQIRPGFRTRFPTLGPRNEPEQVGIFVGKDEPLSPEELLQFLREQIGHQAFDETLKHPADQERCAFCQHEFTTAELHSIVQRPGDRASVLCCQSCVTPQRSVIGLAYYVEERLANVPMEQWPQHLRVKMKATLRILKEHAQTQRRVC